MISNEELILYCSGELDGERRAAIASELETDRELGARLNDIRNDLELLKQCSPIKAPAGFRTSLHNTLDNAIAQDAVVRHIGTESVDKPVSGRKFTATWPLMGMAATLLLALGFGLGYLQRHSDTGPKVVDATVQEQPMLAATEAYSSRPVAGASRGVRAHLADVQQVLIQLSPDNTLQRKQVLLEILLQNRLHQKVAQQQGAEELMRLLRAFEQSLLMLAAQESGQVYARQEQLEFELGVVLTRLEQQASNDKQQL